MAILITPSQASDKPEDQIKKAPSTVWEDVDLKNSPAAIHKANKETDPLVKKENPGEWTATDSGDLEPRCKKGVWIAVGIPIASLAVAGGAYLLWHSFG